MTWSPPATIRGRYDDAPAWDPSGKQCSGGPGCPGSLDGVTPEARKLADMLRANFPGVTRIGGYCCRPNTARKGRTSIHGTGRALDIYGAPDVLREVADYLAVNAGALCVQYVIYDHSATGAGKSGPYGGPDPHTDHVHAEIRESCESGDTSSGKASSVATGGVALVVAFMILWALGAK